MSWPAVPVTLLGMVLGIGGLGNGWRTAARLWDVPAGIGDALSLLAVAVWAVVLTLYAGKWVWARDAALAEARHPILGFFLALVPVSTMIASVALAPYLPALAQAMAFIGVAALVAFSTVAVGGAWQGGRTPDALTPVIYMPTVGGGFVSAIALGTFGHADWGVLFFGAGAVSWLILEAVVVQRLLTQGLPTTLRATLGIHLAPPAVGTVAYLSVTAGPPDHLVHMLFGYALFQALVMTRLLPWLREQAFGAGYWAYSFGVSALPLAALRFIERGDTGPIATLAVPLFIAANLIIGTLMLGTLVLLLRGKLLPAPVPAAGAADSR